MENVLLTSIRIEELKAVISDTVRSELSKHLENRDAPRPAELLTRKAAAKFLDISLPTLLEFTKTGKVKGYRIGTRVRYKQTELEQALNQIQSVKDKRG
jgi:excisionase family DNA binding protein